jgi:hypothetical protein
MGLTQGSTIGTPTSASKVTDTQSHVIYNTKQNKAIGSNNIHSQHSVMNLFYATKCQSGPRAKRKLSVVVIVSPPEDYEGGDFSVDYSGTMH